MGYLEEILVLKPHFKSHKVDSDLTISSAASGGNNWAGKNILFYLKPVGILLRFFGVFPYNFNLGEGTSSSTTDLSDGKSTLLIKFNRRGWLFYSFLIFLLTSCYMAFQLVSLVISAENGVGLIKIAAQSLWFLSPVTPYILVIFIILKGNSLVQIFDEWSAIERDLEKLFCPIMTRRHIRRFRRIYLILAIISVAFCVIHAIKQPKEPVYPFYYLRDDQYTEVDHWIYVVFQMLLISWMWAGLFVLEGISCLFATVIVQCMDTLMIGLETSLTGFQDLKEISDYVDNPSTDHEHFVHSTVHSVMHFAKTNKTESAKQDRTDTESHAVKDPAEFSKLHKEGYIIFVVKKMQRIAALQGKINKIMGPLLLIDVGQLVVSSCILLFLPIRFAKLFDIDSTMAFAGNAITVFSRLIIFIVCLGNVFTKGQDMNMALAKALSASDLSTNCQNPVLAHLTVFSTNPISFTAWDFFPITRGTLLAALSLISTYAVIFFQLNF